MPSTAIAGVKLTPNLSPLTALERALLTEAVRRIHDKDHSRCSPDGCFAAWRMERP